MRDKPTQYPMDRLKVEVSDLLYSKGLTLYECMALLETLKLEIYMDMWTKNKFLRESK